MIKDKNIELVKNGYEIAAELYREQKDASQHEIEIFKKWLLNDNNTEILELGCASGFPIGEAILTSGRNYLGIDLSEKHIQMAKESIHEFRNNFQVAEMLEFVKSAESESYTGIVSMFSIRHLPRIYLVELYSNLLRILRKDGQLLIDCSAYVDRGTTEKWLGDSTMYWSGFSPEWTKLTLKEIGFRLIETQIDKKEFFGELEETLFLLLQK